MKRTRKNDTRIRKKKIPKLRKRITQRERGKVQEGRENKQKERTPGRSK